MNWQRWRSEIAKAVDGSHHTIETVEQQLIERRLHAWMTEDCCILIEIIRYPAETACQYMWAAGDLAAILAEEPRIVDWAVRAGCTEILVESRPAWAKALKPLGYDLWSVTVRKALHGPLH